MASYNELNQLIDAYINRNGVQAITGQILNGVLKAMVEQLGRGYTIMGMATPATDPGTPDAPETYFATTAGTYTNFGGITVQTAELAFLSYNPTGGTWTKETIFDGFARAEAMIDNNTGTPSVDVSYTDGVLTFAFHNLKGDTGPQGLQGVQGEQGPVGPQGIQGPQGDPGQQGQQGEPGAPGEAGQSAGFGAVSATVDNNVGTPSVEVSASGPDTAKVFSFSFHNLKGAQGIQGPQGVQGDTGATGPQGPQGPQGIQGEQGIQGVQGPVGPAGVDSCVVTVDNTTGTPSCVVSLQGQQLTLAFTGLKGAQGNTGSSVDYPFTIVNNLTTNDATQALSAAMGVELGKAVQDVEDAGAALSVKLNLKRDVSLGSNIVDLGAVSRNSAINISGEIVTGLSDSYMISDYIPVDGKDIISNGWKDTSLGWSTYAVYDENLSLRRTIGNNRQYTYQSGDYYVRITFQAHPNDAQANYGTTLLEFEPYTQNYDFESGLASLDSKISPLYEKNYSYEELGDGYYRTPSLFYNNNTYRYIKLSAKDVTSFYTELRFPAPVPAILIIGPNNTLLHSYNTDDADILYKKEITAEELVGAEYIVVQTYNYSVATYDFVLNVRFSTIRIRDFSNPKNIIKVGKDNEYFNYNEIQPALESITNDSADNPYVIEVYPGDYKPFQIQSNRARYISIIGVEKYSTKVICTSGKYDDSTTLLHLYGIVSGLTFISNFEDFASESDYVTWINTAGNNGAYALHIDGSLNSISQNLIVENCIIRSSCNSSLGIGLHQNEKLIIKNCDIYYDASDAVSQRFVRGAIYCHSYPVSSEQGISVTNQNFRLDGNRINGKNNGTSRPSFLSYIEYMSNNQGQCNFEFFDNIFVPNGVERTKQVGLVMTYGTNPFSTYINEASHGNNVATLNKPEFSQ